ncbi:MAG: hypothetical protein GX458_02505, partial [Phyllobacteriaceae bacterium]|nr:hypothetical protein [Phyllobacteriaceae bacterium]
MMAILAMDAYNRGYNTSLELGSIQSLGTAVFKTDSSYEFSVEATRASGFYAVAYTWNDETIISYRRTDNPSFFADPVKGAGDVWSGWTIGAGYANASQAAWAEKFYQAVTNQSVWADTAPSNVVLTGHSLGGGLAEYVASLARTSALVFDTMPSGGAAALAWISQNPAALAQALIDALTAGYGPQLVAMPSVTNIRHIYTGGEFREAVRALTGNGIISALGAALSGADPALAAAAA